MTEGIAAADPLGGDAGKLLDNMLRAMQLHRHPRVFVTALERPAPGARTAEGAAAPADVAAALAEVVTTLQPALVLVLGILRGGLMALCADAIVRALTS